MHQILPQENPRDCSQINTTPQISSATIYSLLMQKIAYLPALKIADNAKCMGGFEFL